MLFRWDSTLPTCRLFPLPSQSFFQADKAVVADNEVIDQFDIEVKTGGDELFGDGDIFNIYMENVDPPSTDLYT